MKSHVWLLGKPVGHSKSPKMHNAAYAHMGLDWVYLAAEVEPEELKAALDGLWALKAIGVNLTVPHKETGAQHCAELTPAAQEIGAVNMLKRGPRGWIGDNTDWRGWLDSWSEEIGESLNNRKAIVLGAGGASRAILYALRSAGARTVLLNRTPGRGGARALSEFPQELEAGCVVVNTTSAGLQNQSPVEWPQDTPSDMVVCDLVYWNTPFLKTAKAGKTLDGKGMLVHQAAHGIRWWCGQEPPVELMREQIA